MDSKERAASIAAKNDEFRKKLGLTDPASLGHGMVVMTAGVNAAFGGILEVLLRAVREYKDFSPANNPHEEHDFGNLEVADEKIFWKFDYFADSQCEMGSEDPSDESKCFRVLTIMLASEY